MDVVRHQRDRMLAAMAEAVAEEGYSNVSVTTVIRRAGVSRATFYEQFTDRHDCFLAAYDRAVEILVDTVRPALLAGGEPPSFRRLLRAYLEALAANPAFSRVFLVDVYSAGADGFRRRAATQARFVDLIAGIYRVESAAGRFACEALVAAISSMVTTKVADGDFDGLLALADPLGDLAGSMLAGSATSRPGAAGAAR